MNDTREQLDRAYRFIKHDHTAEAQQILRSLLDRDSANIDAWWLLAHAETDPDDIRHALHRVLALDADYPNAAKAREMLGALDASFPTPGDLEALAFMGDESLAPPVETEEAFVEGTFAPAVPAGEAWDDRLAPELEGADFLDEEDGRISELAASADPFRELEQSLLSLGAEGDEEPGIDSADLLMALADNELDLEALLELEEGSEDADHARQPHQRRTRRRRPWGLLALVAGVAVLAALWAFVIREEDDTPHDAPLSVLPVEDVAVASLLQTLNTQLETAGLGPEYRAVLANSGLGRTLYIEFCAEPGLALAETIVQGMELVARQAASADGHADAVGVWINRCQADPPDTLFRAEASLETAKSYVAGALGTGEAGLASFQALWTQS
jgi:hypothetical protein